MRLWPFANIPRFTVRDIGGGRDQRPPPLSVPPKVGGDGTGSFMTQNDL